MARDVAILIIFNKHLYLGPFTHNILLNLYSSSVDNIIPTFRLEKTGSLRGEMIYTKPQSKMTKSAF